MTLPEDRGNTGRRRLGKAAWAIIGGIAALAVALAAVLVFGSVIAPGSDGTGATETAEESATSGPGHNTTSGTEPPTASNASASGSIGNSTGQIPDSELAFGKETDTSR